MAAESFPNNLSPKYETLLSKHGFDYDCDLWICKIFVWVRKSDLDVAVVHCIRDLLKVLQRDGILAVFFESSHKLRLSDQGSSVTM